VTGALHVAKMTRATRQGVQEVALPAIGAVERSGEGVEQEDEGEGCQHRRAGLPEPLVEDTGAFEADLDGERVMRRGGPRVDSQVVGVLSAGSGRRRDPGPAAATVRAVADEAPAVQREDGHLRDAAHHRAAHAIAHPRIVDQGAEGRWLRDARIDQDADGRWHPVLSVGHGHTHAGAKRLVPGSVQAMAPVHQGHAGTGEHAAFGIQRNKRGQLGMACLHFGQAHVQGTGVRGVDRVAQGEQRSQAGVDVLVDHTHRATGRAGELATSVGQHAPIRIDLQDGHQGDETHGKAERDAPGGQTDTPGAQLRRPLVHRAFHRPAPLLRPIADPIPAAGRRRGSVGL